MMISDNIRKIQSTDLHKIVELEHRCFSKQNAYSKRQLQYLITKANSCCLAEVENEIIRGFIIVLYRKGSRVAGIETISVDPCYQGMGIGRKLLIAAELEMYPRSISRVRLEVSSGNMPAIHLYEKLGFKIIKTLKDYYMFQYFGTNDAFRMIKDLAI
jgi:[ribosomal protein S18]-alanine N-acetyltransferase